MPHPSSSLADHAILRPVAPAEAFRGDACSGFIVSKYRPADLQAELTRVLNPAAAIRTIHWNRNYLYLTELHTMRGAVPVVVKQFRGDGWTGWRRASGLHAARQSWEIARAMTRAGIGTPEPVLVAQPDDPGQPAFFVTRFVDEAHNARALLRALNADEIERSFGWSAADVLEWLPAAIRQMHDAGFCHGDVSPDNVLVQPSAGRTRPDVLFVDLNRARRARPGILRRSRDLCRLSITRSSDRLDFVNAYWRGSERAFWFKIACYAAAYHAFRLRERARPRLKRALLRWRDWLWKPRANPHIPASDTHASPRDKAVWDPLSDQPYQRATRWEKWSLRAADSPEHARAYMAAVAAAPRIWRRYRALKAARFAVPSRFEGAGLSVRPLPGHHDRLLDAIDALGVRHVLIRLHPWEDAPDDAQRLARDLDARGVEVTLSLAQNRALVKNRTLWCEAVDRIADRLAPFSRHVQIGQAINRSKWGLWTLREYQDLFASAAEVLRRRRPDVALLGPAVIDFEFEHLAAAVNLASPDVRFDIVSSLLYVDRRGAPENRQLGLDTTDKVTLLRAIADTATHASPRVWITEINWALWEGPYSPAGRRASVDETTQADYLTRYYVLALSTGLVERVFWWQLAARGYGLIDIADRGAWRRRPSFDALATVIRQLEGSLSLGPVSADRDARLFRFRRDRDDVIVGWTTRADAHDVRMPSQVHSVLDRDGLPSRLPRTREVRLTGSPQYFVVSSEPGETASPAGDRYGSAPPGGLIRNRS